MIHFFARASSRRLTGTLVCAVVAFAGLVVDTGCSPQSQITPLAVSAPPQPRISYSIKGFCAQAGNTFGDMFLINSSYVISMGQIQLDTDRDGVPDFLDNDPSVGITFNSPFSLPNGFGDLAAFATGIPVASQTLLMGYNTCDNPNLDSDGDGLSDCAETTLLKTNAQNFDTDGDGIPDELELRFGLNPLDPSDGQLNATGDGITNIQKIKMQLPLREGSTAIAAQAAHTYQVQPTGQNAQGQSCFDLSVTNIPVVSVPNGNLIISYVLEKTMTGTSGASVKLNRCCSVVPSATADGVAITETWGSADLACPCPLALDLKG